MRHPHCLAAEPLEKRIAPAAAGLVVTPDGKKATWIDVDGDFVTLTASVGVLDNNDFKFLAGEAEDPGAQLAVLDLYNDMATGVNLTFTAKRYDAPSGDVGKLGDGSVNVGWILAAGTNIGKITLPGDLARLDIGNGDLLKPATTGIIVNSAGVFGTSTQLDSYADGGPALDWIIFGKLPSLTIKGDVFSSLYVTGTLANPALGSIGTLSISGDVIGGNAPSIYSEDGFGSGYVSATGAIGAVKIGGDIIGGPAYQAGALRSNGTIASVTVGGSIYGGSGDSSGSIFGKGVGPVTVAGSLIGGYVREVEEDVFVPSFSAGSIGSEGKLGAVKIGGNVIGSAQSYFGGTIFTVPGSGGKLDSVTITGALSGTTDVYEGEEGAVLLFNGIYSDGQLGPVKVGALAGGSTGPVHIVAKGKINPANATEALAIASVTVTRGAYGAEILAGFNSALTDVNPDVQIGAIKVGNNWAASSISAGVGSGTDLYYGNEPASDEGIAVALEPFSDKASIRSKIASITIGGTVYGTSSTEDSYGFVAQELGPIKIGGVTLELKANTLSTPLDIFKLGYSGDFWAREYAV